MKYKRLYIIMICSLSLSVAFKTEIVTEKNDMKERGLLYVQ